LKLLLQKLFQRSRLDTTPPPELARHRVLFVCMGNICRSPTAEGVFRHLVAARAPELSIHIESAGTHAYHIGEPPDPRARRAAARRGVDIGALRARQVQAEDFARFDWIVVMDEQNRAHLRTLSSPEHHSRIRLLLEFAPQLGRADVPDPYYGGANGFDYVLDLVEEAGAGLLETILRAEATARKPEPAERST
jgi:protein-tyrosine phosphatase